MDSGGTTVDSWTESPFLIRPDSRNTVEVLLREATQSKAVLRRFQIRPLPPQRPSTSSSSTESAAAATSFTATREANQQTVCILHWEDEVTAERLAQTLGVHCAKTAFNDAMWECPDSFSSLYILVNDKVAEKFSKERIFDTVQWIDEFDDLGRPILAVRCTDNESLFKKTFYRLPGSPQEYEWPEASVETQNNLNNSNIQIGFTNHCILEMDENGRTMITQFPSDTNILDVTIGDSCSENTTKIVLTTMNDIPGMDKKLFTVYNDNRYLINTYLPTEAGATVVSVERGSVILNLKLDKGVNLEEFLKVRLRKILDGCLKKDLLRQVGDKFKLDVKIHTKLTVDLLGNLGSAEQKETEEKLIQTNVTWIETNPKYIRNGQSGNSTKSVTYKKLPSLVSSTEISPADDVQTENPEDTKSGTSEESDVVPSKQSKSIQPKVVSTGRLSSPEKETCSAGPTSVKFNKDPVPETSGRMSLGPSASSKSQQTSHHGEKMSKKRFAYDTGECMTKLLSPPCSESKYSEEVTTDQGSTYAPKKLKSCEKLFKGQLAYFERPKTKVRGYFKIAECSDFGESVFFDTLYVGRTKDVRKSLDELMISNSDAVNLNNSSIEGYIAAMSDEEREKKIMVFWIDKDKDAHKCKGKSMLDCIKEYCVDCPQFNSTEEVWSEEETKEVKRLFSPKKQTFLTDVMSKKTVIKREPIDEDASGVKKMKLM